MAFKNLAERFAARAKEVYGHGSIKEGPNTDASVEFKPDDPRAEETLHDSRFLPIGSVRRDTQRIGNFLKSNAGVLFFVNQGILQASNTFSETRLYNPVFALGNVVPTLHLRRPLFAQNSFAVSGDASQAAPPALDARIFSAGRLQKNSSTEAIARVVGNGGSNGLLSLLDLFKVSQTLSAVLALKDTGTLGINNRPELNVDGNGEYFSVALWRGFRKLNSLQSNLAGAAASLRVGDIKGAANSLKNVVSTETQRPEDRENASFIHDGRRYFFTVNGSDERYIQHSVQFTTDAEGKDRPVVVTPFATRRPYMINVVSNTSTPLPTNFVAAEKIAANSFTNNLKKVTINAGSILSGITGKLGLSSFNSTALASAKTALNSVADTVAPKVESAEDAMHFSSLALSKRYATDERLSFIRKALDDQKTKSFKGWEGKSTLKSLGFMDDNIVSTGKENNPDATMYRGGRYMSDAVGLQTTMKTGASGLDEAGLNAYQSQVGTSTVLVIFYDFGGKQAIPFRAFITGLTETVIPEISDTRYVGRIERNIVYTGATREVNFQLRVHAFSLAELDGVWEKINHMTGLCFPAGYSNGYMVPPFVKLTIGGIYHDQPGYIRSLTHAVEENTSWEVDGKQVPHGVTMNIAYSIIERSQVQTGSPFYAITGG